MAWKLMKKGSVGTYRGQKVRIKEILLDKALVSPVGSYGKNEKVVSVDQIKNISPRPIGEIEDKLKKKRGRY